MPRHRVLCAVDNVAQVGQERFSSYIFMRLIVRDFILYHMAMSRIKYLRLRFYTYVFPSTNVSVVVISPCININDGGDSNYQLTFDRSRGSGSFCHSPGTLVSFRII